MSRARKKTSSAGIPPAAFQVGPRRVAPVRHIVESFILLAIAVPMFRAFALEGYMISTGSMAPTLLGFHHRIVCPECRYSFAVGDSDVWRDSEEVPRSAKLPERGAPLTVTCPNCGNQGISTSEFARNEGDQLLVAKLAYLHRPPRRWEVVVFQNPGNSRQAYVKRVVGLPDEHLAIVNGEIVADGLLQRKPFTVQSAIRIPVSSYAYSPPENDPDWNKRWTAPRRNTGWKLQPERLSFAQAAQVQEPATTDWVTYRHWIRAGGRHQTRVPLQDWPDGIELPDSRFSPVRYENGELVSYGALSDLELRRYLAYSDAEVFQKAFRRLFLESHIAPILDESGYNGDWMPGRYAVDDLQLSLCLGKVAGTGRFEIDMNDGDHQFRLVLDFGRGRLQLLQDDNPVPLQEKTLRADAFQEPRKLELSLFDQQVICALDGEPIFPARPYDGSGAVRELRRPARFGATGIDCEVTELVLYRDVYYTPPEEDQPNEWQMTSDEWFVLGDNSPVSVDSRYWPRPGVPQRALIGKPLVVHLPSRQSQFRWGGSERSVRVPDFSRMRWIH